MAQKILARGFSTASCPSQTTTRRRTIRCAAESPSSAYFPKTAKDLCSRCCVGATSRSAHREPACTMVPLRKEMFTMWPRISESYQKSSFSEHWIEDVICDIVKHINEAPFLQLLFEPRESSKTGTSQRQRVQPAGQNHSADEKWKEMESYVHEASPDGLIFVHHLQGNSLLDSGVNDELVMTTTRDAGDKVIDNMRNGKDLWGVLVLGNTKALSACYILETTNVASPFGRCTSFCLTKAQSFGTAWLDQIQSSWLLKTDN